MIDCTGGDVRLVGGAHKFQGTVEICLDGSWCLVSQHGWDNRDARIVCRELGGYNPSGMFTTKKSCVVDRLLREKGSEVKCK